jgi:hypothetical protein
MSTDKAYEQLKLAALEVKSMLIDIDENIQPSVNEIEKLASKLGELNEQIVIYKYLKGQTELSPSFNIHLKVNEKIDAEEEIKTTLHRPLIETKDTKEPDLYEQKTEQTAKKLELNLNDKFRIINELFGQSTTEFNLAIDQLNTIANFERSTDYLNELKHLYNWKGDEEMAIKLYYLNKRRF